MALGSLLIRRKSILTVVSGLVIIWISIEQTLIPTTDLVRRLSSEERNIQNDERYILMNKSDKSNIIGMIEKYQVEVIDGNNNGYASKPRFIIHIGPSKTASSTLQADCANFTDVLRQDNYVYLGKFSPWKEQIKYHHLLQAQCAKRNLSMFVSEKEKEEENAVVHEFKCFKQLRNTLEQFQRRKQSVIVSYEEFSYYHFLSCKCIYTNKGFFEAVHDVLKDWDVLVVGTYRRYAEWALSALKELNTKPTSKTTIWEGGRPLLHTWDTIQSWADMNFTGASFYLYIDNTIPVWDAMGFKTAIMTFPHHEDDRHITTQFFCDILQDTPHTCKYTQQRLNQTKLRQRSLTHFAYNTIVYHAAEKGLIDKNKIGRPRATEDLIQYHTNKLGLSWLDLPLQCPKQQQLEALLNKSLQLEKELMPQLFMSPEGEIKHRESFWRLANERMEFCSVDVDMVLRDKATWKQLRHGLHKINNTTITILENVQNVGN